MRHKIVHALTSLAHSRLARGVGLFVFALLLLFALRMTDIPLMRGNFGSGMTNAHIILYIFFAFLFALFVAATVYKMHYFGAHEKKHTVWGSIGGFLGILVTGCASCTITVASFIGLAGLIALLPRHGLELKILGICLLLYATYQALLTLDSCAVRSHKK